MRHGECWKGRKAGTKLEESKEGMLGRNGSWKGNKEIRLERKESWKGVKNGYWEGREVGTQKGGDIGKEVKLEGGWGDSGK